MWPLALLVFLLGLCVGSFLNVVILRTHEREHLDGRSRCPSCRATLGWFDLVPVFSFLVLKGRCRQCKAPISFQYPLVELATGAIFLLMYLRAAGGPQMEMTLLRDLIFSAFLIVIFVYDLRYFLILDRFTIPAMILAIVFNLWLGMSAWSLIAGAAFIGGFFLLQYVISRGKWIGDGDIRMGVLMGLMLGLSQGLVALFLSYVIGAAASLLLLACKKATPQTRIPFGTFLSIGTFLALVAGEPLLDWYLGLFG